MNDLQTRFQALRSYHLPISDLKFESSIGVGAFGEVWIGRNLVNDVRVAIKKLHRSDPDEASLGLYCREVESLASMSHRFILPFIGFTVQPPYCVVTKFIPNGSLFAALRDDPHSLQLTPTDLSVIACGVAEGMRYLHGLSYIHRDIKSQNILLDENKLPIICDFGSSRRASRDQELTTGDLGTPQYMAPEFLRGESYTHTVDIYSYGMILWEMLTRTTPFEGINPAQVIFQVGVHHKRPPIPDDVPESLALLIQRCWSSVTTERPGFSEIMNEFKSGAVAFSGTDHKLLQERLDPVVARARTTATPSRRTKGGSIRLSASPMAPIGPVALGTGVLAGLSDSDPDQIRRALNFLEQNLDATERLGKSFFPPLLSLLIHTPLTPIAEEAQRITLLLARIPARLDSVRSVADLENYVAPRTLEFFLYVATYMPETFTLPVVEALIKVGETLEHAHKVAILLSKSLSMSKNMEVVDAILEHFEKNVARHVDNECGTIMLRMLTTFGRIDDEVIAAYFVSHLSQNCAYAYEALFSKGDEVKPNLLKVPTLLVHINADHDHLRRMAIDFVLKFARDVDGEVLVQIAGALIISAIRFSSEAAILLLCRFALQENQAAVLLRPAVARTWLISQPSKAVLMMRLFCVLIKEKQHRQFLLSFPEVPAFLAAVLNAQDWETFFAVCWSVRVADGYREFLAKLATNSTPELLGQVILITDDLRTLQAASSALITIADCGYSPAYLRVIPALLEMVAKAHPAIHHCLNLLEKVSEYKETLQTFVNSNVAEVLGALTGPDLHGYVVEIYLHLKAAGLVLAG